MDPEQSTGTKREAQGCNLSSVSFQGQFPPCSRLFAALALPAYPSSILLNVFERRGLTSSSRGIESERVHDRWRVYLWAGSV